MQNKGGTTMERAKLKKKRKYGRDQIKLSKDQIFQSYFHFTLKFILLQWGRDQIKLSKDQIFQSYFILL
jgi:hypothetical protein